MEPQPSRRHWSRVTLTLSPEAADALATLAQDNYRNRKQEALRLLLDGIAREARSRPERAG